MTILLVVAVLCLIGILVVALACLCSYLDMVRQWDEILVMAFVMLPGCTGIAILAHDLLRYLWVHR